MIHKNAKKDPVFGIVVKTLVERKSLVNYEHTGSLLTWLYVI